MENFAIMAVLLLSTLLNALYFIPFIVNAFRGEKPTHGEASWMMVVAMVLTACAVIGLFTMPDRALHWAVNSWSVEVPQ